MPSGPKTAAEKGGITGQAGKRQTAWAEEAAEKGML
jgi:hypothetical protein